MVGIIAQLNDISITNTHKTHDLLDKVIASVYDIYKDDNIRFNQQNVAFEYKINDTYTMIIGRDLNAFAVITRVVNTNSNNDVVGECVIDISGAYNRRFGEIDTDVRTNIAAVFAAIGNIDTTLLESSTPSEEAESPAEPEKVEAEVVSEG